MTTKWEAAQAKMALLNLSETEIIAALWRLPDDERALFYKQLIGLLTYQAGPVPAPLQHPLQSAHLAYVVEVQSRVRPYAPDPRWILVHAGLILFGTSVLIAMVVMMFRA